MTLPDQTIAIRDAMIAFKHASSRDRSNGPGTGEPLPLYRDIPKGKEFPAGALGPILGGMARALHEAAVQSPLAICGTSVLAAAAVSTQGLQDVVLPLAGGTPKPLSLYFLIVARSGERKTATDALVLVPVKKRAAELQEDYDAKITDHKNTLDIWKSERARILKKKPMRRPASSNSMRSARNRNRPRPPS
jgi:hypothetical protein